MSNRRSGTTGEVSVQATTDGITTISQLNKYDPNMATFPATAPAAATSRNGHPLIAFDDTTNENIEFHDIVSQDYLEGNLTVDITWLAATATTGDVKWNVQFETLAALGQDWDNDSFDTVQTATSTTAATSGIATKTSIPLTRTQADGISKGGTFRLRITRDAADGGDTMVGDAQIGGVLIRQ